MRVSRSWAVFCAGNLVIVLALIWTTHVVLSLERSELRARAETTHQQSLRLALWRMDSWLALLLAREAALPTESEIDADADTDTYIRLRFEIDGDGRLSRRQGEVLDADRSYLALPAIQAAMEQADLAVAATLTPADDSRPLVTDVNWSRPETARTQLEFDARVACSVPRPTGAASGRQLVVWLESAEEESESALTFLRRAADGQSYSGYILNWPTIERRLLSEISDLFPDAQLVRATGLDDSAPPGHGLANIPVTLLTPPPAPIAVSRITGGRSALALAWLSTLIAAVAVGLTLRKHIELGERRRRFVAAVTHELRTPLTTFQLYSEMLADGLVEDEDQRREYLHTLKEEARRLSATVDNVLTYARVSRRKTPRCIESMSLGGLVERLRPSLERRVASSGLGLEIVLDSPPATSVAVDSHAIDQILGSLVDNAVKYAGSGGAEPPTVRIAAGVADGTLNLTVRDHGPGVPREHAAAIFDAFERGVRGSDDPTPGLGLGLALARGLARDIGGELSIEQPEGAGARFRLTVSALLPAES